MMMMMMMTARLDWRCRDAVDGLLPRGPRRASGWAAGVRASGAGRPAAGAGRRRAAFRARGGRGRGGGRGRRVVGVGPAHRPRARPSPGGRAGLAARGQVSGIDFVRRL